MTTLSFGRACVACVIWLLPFHGSLGQAAPVEAAAIPGIRGAVVTSLDAFPWAQVECAGPRYAALDPVVLELGPDETFRLSELDLKHLNRTPYQWHLRDSAASFPVLGAHSDTLRLRAWTFPVEPWADSPSVPIVEPERQAARERWNAALESGEELAIVAVWFDRCWAELSDAGTTASATLLLTRRNSRWVIDRFIDIITP